VRIAASVLIALVVTTSGATAATVRSHLAPGWDDGGPRWSPNGVQLLFDESTSPAKSPGMYRLELMHADGTGLRALSRPANAGDQGAIFSPDGKQLLITREIYDEFTHVVVVRNLATGTSRTITPPGFEETAGGWSPDGGRIVVLRSSLGTAKATAYTELPDGTDAHQVSSGQVYAARYLAGGEQIALLRARGPSYVAVAPATGGPERRLTPEGEWGLVATSPDGNQVLASHNAAEADPTLWVANVDGSGRRLVAKGAADGEWSKDGAWIVYAGGEFTKDHAIRIVRATGGTPRILVPRGLAPALSPDGRTLAYTDRGPCFAVGVYVIRVAGGPARRLTQDCRIHGTSRADVLLGTSARDVINGGGGNDVIRANPGDRPNVYYGVVDDDAVDGGSGNDTIYGYRGTDVLRGGPGADRIYGGRGLDRLSGGPGRDILDGGPYHDRIDARDGERDVVRCGGGVDRVLADSIDVVARDCEHVTIARR
jgi:Tol biopolymer transport system component